MTLMQETSLQAYKELKSDGKLQPEELKVIYALETYGPMTDIEIANMTGLDKNAVNGRRNSLFKKEIVVKRGEKLNLKSGKNNIVWGLYSRLI